MNRLSKIYLTCGLLLICNSCSASDLNEFWIYRSLYPASESPEVTIDAVSGKLTVGDLTGDMEICAQIEKFQCFVSKWISFAVPRSQGRRKAEK